MTLMHDDRRPAVARLLDEVTNALARQRDRWTSVPAPKRALYRALLAALSMMAVASAFLLGAEPRMVLTGAAPAVPALENLRGGGNDRRS